MKNEGYRKINQATNRFKILTSQLNEVILILSTTNVAFAMTLFCFNKRTYLRGILMSHVIKVQNSM